MATKTFPINYKKIPYYLLLMLLTAGASIILGFLSFSGMIALLPVISLAFATFGLSVAYEGEVYLQNIKGTLKKLFKSNYLENYLAKEFLLKHFPAPNEKDCPQFFIDYADQLKLLSLFSNKELNKESKKRKQQIEKTLKEMEKWFAKQLFADKKKKDEEPSAYTLELRSWLAKHEQTEWKTRLEQRQSAFNAVKAFSVLSAAFMGLGSTYLIVEAFAVIPFVAAIPFVFWPLIIVPMAIIAGTAYGMLTYNAMTDLINNDTIKKWYHKIRDDLSQGKFFIPIMAVFLFVIGATLTICTAGTWWTVATNARPLFEWMTKMPSFIMGIINPIVTGISTIIFNSQNISESLEMIEEASHSEINLFQRAYNSILEGFAHLKATENVAQMLNPFRILLKLTITPLRILLFLGHLVSIALTSDRMPGVPQILSALVAIISEGFEDAHYFMGGNDSQLEEKDHDNLNKLLENRLGANSDHQNNTDIPTRIIITLAIPLYALAALWDWMMSKDDPTSKHKALTWTQAWNKQRGIQEEVNVSLPKDAKRPSKSWQVEHTASVLDQYEENHFKNIWFGLDSADEKRKEIRQLKQKVRSETIKGGSLKDILDEAKSDPVYNQHRLFALHQEDKTATVEFLDDLPERVNAI